VGLGPDRRPALAAPDGPTPADAVAPTNWKQGLARSLYDRYRLHHDGRSEIKAPLGDTPRRQGPTDPHERIEEEIARTCSPYGLGHREHRAVLVSIAVGFSVGEAAQGPPPRVWGAWRAERDVVEIPPPAGDLVDGLPAFDPVLVEALQSRAGILGRDSALDVLRDQVGDLANCADIIAMAVARRTWMALHLCERELVGPAPRRALAWAINSAATYAVHDALRWGLWDPAAANDTASPTATPASPGADRFERETATVALLVERLPARLPVWRDAVVRDDVDLVRAEYSALLDTSEVADVAWLLTPDELVEMIRDDWGDL
jgi:hypothetical protein